MAKPVFSSAYIHRYPKHHFATINNEESLAQASDMEDADINIIMKKYSGTGMLPQVNMEALTGDFSDVGDFREAQDKIKAANDAFAEVPAELRRRFNNDPQEFINFVLDDKNLEETVKLGYRTRPDKTPEPVTPKKEENDNGK